MFCGYNYRSTLLVRDLLHRAYRRTALAMSEKIHLWYDLIRHFRCLIRITVE